MNSTHEHELSTLLSNESCRCHFGLFTQFYFCLFSFLYQIVFCFGKEGKEKKKKKEKASQKTI